MAAKSGDIGDFILQALNQARDTKINPAIAQNMPDPLNIDVGKSGSASAGCIIPNPFGGCICHASASYSVSMKDVKGLHNLHVTNFTTASVSADMSAITVGADIADPDVEVSGDAHARVSACGISPSASGRASTHASIQKMHLAAAATSKFDSANNCIQLSFTKITVELDQVPIHDTSVKIDLGPIPGVDVGKLVDLVHECVPDLTTVIEKAAQGPMSRVMTNAAANRDIPCVKIPPQSSSAQDVQLV